MKPVLFILFLISAIFAGAQSVFVRDSKTGKPIEGVVVLAEKIKAQTDKEGKVDISEFKDAGKMIFGHSSYIEVRTNYINLWSNNFVLKLQEDPVRIDEIVISANRREQSRLEIPNKIVSISKKEIEFQNPQTAADLLEYKSGVFVQKSQMGGGSPMIRGFSANRLLLVVDGIKMNNAIYRNGNLHNIISLDAGSIESTEVIFGPGSVIYGSDALGGVISYQTLKPKLSSSDTIVQKGNVFGRFATASYENTFHGDYNFGTSKLAGLMSITLSGFGDLKMGSNGHDEYIRKEYAVNNSFKTNGSDIVVSNKDENKQVYSGYQQVNALAKLRYRPNDNFDLNYAFHYSETSDIPRYDRLIQYNKNTLKFGDWFYGPQIWKLHSLDFKLSKSFFLFDKLNVIAGFQDYTESRNDRRLNKPELNTRTENVLVYSANVDFDKKINSKNTLYYGFEGILNKVGSRGISTNLIDGNNTEIDTRYPDGSETSGIAAYLSYKTILGSKFTFHLGGRTTLNSAKGAFSEKFYKFPLTNFNTSHNSTTGSFGMVYHPTSNWQLNLNTSTGFRAPNIDDIAKVFESTPGNVMVPNTGLKPEYAQNYEIGIIRRIQKIAKIEIDGFYTYLENAMVRSDFLFNNRDSIIYDGVLSKVEALVNADYANIIGGSISIDLYFSPKLLLKNSVSYSYGEDSYGDPIRHAAPLFGSSHLTFFTDEFQFVLYGRFNGQITNENMSPSEKEKPEIYAIDKEGNPYSPAWWTLNLKSLFKISQNFSINAGIENILDKRYRAYSSGIVAPGRNLIVSVRYSL